MNRSKQAGMGKNGIIILLVALTLAPVHPAEAQQQAKLPRVGLLVNGSSSNFGPRIDAFRQGLRDLDYIEGKNIFIEYRYSEGKADRLADVAAELVRLKVNLIVTHAVVATQTVKKLTTTIPIVVANVRDAVATGLVTNLLGNDPFGVRKCDDWVHG